MSSSAFSSVNSSPVNSRPSTPFSRPSTPGTDYEALFTDIESFPQNERYILVTGGLGFIGSHTTLELLKSGYNVVVVDDLSNSFRNVYDNILLAASIHYTKLHGSPKLCPKLRFWEADFRNITAMRRLLQAYSPYTWRSNISGVIHFAAFKAVEESIRNPLKYYRNNINGLVDFLALLEEYNVKNFIFSSSATVYGSIADEGKPLREEDCVHKTTTFQDSTGSDQQKSQGCTGITNPYGRTKFFGEAILADVAKSDPTWNITALRYFNPIGCDESGLLGEDPRGTPSNLVPVVVKVMTGQWQELSVFGNDWDTSDGTAVRDFIHVTDLARGHIAALANILSSSLTSQMQERKLYNPEDKSDSFRTFNLGTGHGHSVAEIVSTMEEVSQTKINAKVVGRRDGDVGSCVAVADRAANELKWQTQKSLRDACVDICNFLDRQKLESS